MPKSVWDRFSNGPRPLQENLVPVDMRARRIHGPRARNFRGSRQLGDPYSMEFGQLELTNGPSSLEYPDIPVDMYPRVVDNYQRNADGTLTPVGSPGTMDPLSVLIERIANDTGVIASTSLLRRGLLGRTVTVTTTPQLIINAEYLRGYIILNPNELAGATSAGTILSSALRTATGVSSTLGVANFLAGHYFLDITATAGGGTVQLDLEVLDPASGNWAVAQTIFAATGTVGTTYAFVGELGTPTDVRIAWEIPVGSVTFSVGFVLKNGLIGTSAGISQTIYLGGAGVSTTSGFPLLNGQSQKFFLQENLQLFAVADATLPLKIFEL